MTAGPPASPQVLRVSRARQGSGTSINSVCTKRGHCAHVENIGKHCRRRLYPRSLLVATAHDSDKTGTSVHSGPRSIPSRGKKEREASRFNGRRRRSTSDKKSSVVAVSGLGASHLDAHTLYLFSSEKKKKKKRASLYLVCCLLFVLAMFFPAARPSRSRRVDNSSTPHSPRRNRRSGGRSRGKTVFRDPIWRWPGTRPIHPRAGHRSHSTRMRCLCRGASSES